MKLSNHIKKNSLNLEILLIILIINVAPCFSGKKRINYLPGREPLYSTTSTRHLIPVFGNMEDIINSPPFREKNVADDPDDWSEALSAYDKLLSNPPKKVEPQVDPFRNLKPGIFVPWAYGSDSDQAAVEAVIPTAQAREVGHHHDYDDNDEEAKKLAKLSSRMKARAMGLELVSSTTPFVDGASSTEDFTLVEEKPIFPKKCSKGRSAKGIIDNNATAGIGAGDETGSFLEDGFEHPGSGSIAASNISNIKTDEITLEERLLESAIMSQEMMYGGCGGPSPKGKVCYGVPSGCIEKKTCRLVVSFGLDEQSGQMAVNLAGERSETGFIAFGFSTDRFIGADTIVYCIYVPNSKSKSGKNVALYMAFTEGTHSHLQKKRDYFQANFCPNFGYQKNRIMACSFGLSTNVYFDNGTKVDISTVPYHLMLAFGHYADNLPVNDSDFGALKYQHLIQFSEEPVALNRTLNNPENIKPRSSKLILFHAILSTMAFVFLMPAGMFISKYGREVLGYPCRVLGRFRIVMWLWVHLRMNLLSIPVIFASLISIMVELDFTWRSKTYWTLFHSISGAIAMALALLSFIVGFFFKINNVDMSKTDNEDTKFNCMTWLHWLIGNFTYLFGITSIFIVGSLPRAQAPCFVEYFAYIHLLLHVTSHVVMSIDTRNLVKDLDNNNFCFQRVLLGPMIPLNKKFANFADSLGENAWKGRRRMILFYFIVSFLCAFTISVLMTFPVVLCRRS